MDRETIRSQLVDVAAEVFGRRVELNDEVTAEDIPEWDSLENIRLLVTAEKRFDIKFSGAEAADLHNVGDLVSLIERKLANRDHASA